MRLSSVAPIVVAALALAGIAEARTFPVGVATVDAVDSNRDRTLTTEIWYPARRAGRDAPSRRGSWPLVLVAHGHCGSRTNYEYLTTHLASHGYVVAAPDFPGFCDGGSPSDLFDEPPLDLSFVCRTLHDRGGQLARFAVHVRGVPTGVVGHSLGGLAAVNAALLDPAFTTVVPLAPAVSAARAEPFGDLQPRRAVLVIGGGADQTVPFETSARPFFDALPAPAYLVRIAAGTHSGFTDVDAGLSAEALAAQENQVNRYATALFDRYLRGRPRAARLLRPADDGVVAVEAKTK